VQVIGVFTNPEVSVEKPTSGPLGVPLLDYFRIADNRGVEPGGLRRLVSLKGWAARQHP